MIITIAEIGINHNGDLNIAKDLIKIASLAGFSYCKFQKKNPNLIPEHTKKNIRSTPWGEMTYLEYKRRMEFDKREYDIITTICKKENIKFLCSVWDIDSAKFIKNYTDEVKIPSALITDIELLKYCNDNFKFKIMSTGMSKEEQIEKAVEVLQPQAIMHTNSCYPAPHEELNLQYIVYLYHKWSDVEIGYSGHEVNLQPTLSAVVLGATWIERHVTLDRNMWGSDQLASVEPEGMFKLIKAIRQIEETMKGNQAREIYKSELAKLGTLRKKDYLEVNENSS